MDSAALVASLHGRVLRALAQRTGLHFPGLRAAAAHLRRQNLIAPCYLKKLQRLDDSFAVTRHITSAGADQFFIEVLSALEIPVCHTAEAACPVVDGLSGQEPWRNRRKCRRVRFRDYDDSEEVGKERNDAGDDPVDGPTGQAGHGTEAAQVEQDNPDEPIRPTTTEETTETAGSGAEQAAGARDDSVMGMPRAHLVETDEEMQIDQALVTPCLPAALGGLAESRAKAPREECKTMSAMQNDPLAHLRSILSSVDAMAQRLYAITARLHASRGHELAEDVNALLMDLAVILRERQSIAAA